MRYWAKVDEGENEEDTQMGRVLYECSMQKKKKKPTKSGRSKENSKFKKWLPKMQSERSYGIKRDIMSRIKEG